MIYEFSDLTLDLERHQLTRGGEPVKLTRLSFKMLRALVEASPALISHDVLISRVWGPKRVVTQENLSQRIKTLRQSLGDDPGRPIYIEGVRGAGYRLVPEVRKRSNQISQNGSKRAWLAVSLVILVGLLAWFAIGHFSEMNGEPESASVTTAPVEQPATDPQQQPAIAVLPFANLSADPSNQYFTDGIHDDLLTRISNIRDIKTISRTSVMNYRGSEKKLRTIAKELGVTTILEGGVQRSGDQVRINLQLIDVETDAHLWAQTYTRALSATDVFAVQAEITEAVADALQAILSDDERRQVEKSPTSNLQALEAYFLGNQYRDQHTSESIKLAITSFRQAVRLDPEFSSAFSHLALALLEQVWLGGYPAEAQLDLSRPMIDQAILLDPQSTTAFTALGEWFRIAGDKDKAERAFQQALAFGPNNAIAYSSYGNLMQWERSDLSSAVSLFEKAVELDPQNVGHKIQLAEVMGKVGMTRQAITLMERVVADHPDSSGAYRVLGNLYSSGEFRTDKAIRMFRIAYELDPGHPWNSFSIGNMYYRLGDFENSALWLKHAASLAPDSENAPDLLGWAYLNGGNVERARDQFDRSDSNHILHWIGNFMLARIDLAHGRPRDAIERYLDFEPIFDGTKSFVNFFYGAGAIDAYQNLGEHNKAQALIDDLMSVIDADPPLSYHGVQILDASLYVVSGQPEAAIETLGKWVSQGGASAFLLIQTEYELSALLDDPQFLRLLQTVNARLAEQRANLARWESSGEIPAVPIETADPR